MTQHDIQILEEGCMSNLKKGSHLISILELHHEITSQEPWNPAGALLEPFPGAHLPEFKKKKKLTAFFWKAAVNASPCNHLAVLRAPLLQLKRVSATPSTHGIARWR